MSALQRALPEALQSVMHGMGYETKGIRKDQYNLGINLNQSLYDGGKVSAAAELRREEGLDVRGVSVPGFDVSPRYLYNTTLDYKRYMVPGLLAMLLVLTVGFLSVHRRLH